ncbi:MAG: hypothetical protein FJY20_01990 [Bacteroidetes bacterium]|nr:hypothetical protein [Bacteroidota bacterium]
MKKLLLLTILFDFTSLAAQTDAATLAKKLTAGLNSDHQKVKAIFQWITDNIAYTTFTKHQRKNKYPVPEPDDEGPLKPLNERVAETVLRRRTAFCDGYAKLFKVLCGHAGIRSEIISGYARGAFGRGGLKFGVNHNWNAVFLEDKWQLLDVTWASGYINLRDGEFVRDYNDRYFLTAPEVFIKDHYPDDPRWTLLPDDKVPDEFRHSPFRQKAFAKYSFTSFYPGKGIIEAAVGDTIVLQLETGRTGAGTISPTLNIDSSFFSHSSSWVFLKPDRSLPQAETSPRQQYTYTVAGANVRWLYLLYNDDVVMRYKINVKSQQHH